MAGSILLFTDDSWQYPKDAIYKSGDVFIEGGDTYSDYRKEQMEKAVKYNDIATNSVILQNIVDMSDIIHQLTQERAQIREGWRLF